MIPKEGSWGRSVVWILVLLLRASIPARGADSQVPVFHGESKLVVLQATVRNARGELVTNLGQDAFTVYENGKKQLLEIFRRDDVPVSLGLVIDNSGSMRGLRAHVEAAALSFVRASNPEDEVFVLNFADKTRIDVPLTRDLTALESGIARIDSIGGTAMHDALHVAAEYLHSHGQRDRKALLLITDGFDNASATTLGQVKSLAERSDVVIYAIGLLGDESESKAKRARSELDELTEISGGTAYFPPRPEALDGVALGIARQIRNQYMLAYSPLEKSLDGSYRKLRVVAKGPVPLSVKTRAGYRASPLRQ